MFGRFVFLLVIMISFVNSGAIGEGLTPFTQFNLYSRGNIGSVGAPYQGDIAGVGASDGSAWIGETSINGSGSNQMDFSFYCTGDLTIAGEINHSGLHVGANLLILGATVNGDVIAGSHVSGNGGSVLGDITAGGMVVMTSAYVSGAVNQYVPYLPPITWSYVDNFYITKAQQYREMPATGTPSVGSLIQIDATTLVNVVALDASDLASAWSVTVTGDDGVAVIINVSGMDIDLANMDWQLSDGIERTNVLINCYEATSLDIENTTVVGNVLAPFAACDFSSGTIEGALWVGSLSGAGDVNEGFFSEPDESTKVMFEESWGAIKRLFGEVF